MFSRIAQHIKDHTHGEGSYRQVLAMAFPLILSTSAWSIQHFVDRMFLTWFSQDAVAASMPAGILNFTIMSLFIGTASYTSTFVAQYFGANRKERIGPAVWQGIYVSLVGGVALALMIPLARPFFQWVGHAPAVIEHEVVYFQILCLGAFPVIAASALSGFFSGLGRTWTTMWVSFVSTFVNIVGDYLLIFGNLGFPKMGVAGAAIATVLSGVANMVILTALFSRKDCDRQFHTRQGWRLDRELFRRLIKFGFPTGVQFFLDVAGFTIFILLVGKIGPKELAATTIAFNINTLAFMPMIGMGIAVSVLVGQYLGQNHVRAAEKSIYSGLHLSTLYMGFVAILFVFIPGVFTSPFSAKAGHFNEIQPLVVILLRFVALYCLFDSMNIIFSSALKGAGDTQYVMYMIVTVSLLVLVIPSYLALQVFHGGIMAAWIIATLYVILLGFSFLFRFLKGKWKTMRVIEEVTPFVPQVLSEAPAIEME